jgi:carbamoylphosphate synthase large subunit
MNRILFAFKDDWVEPVRERLDGARYEARFQDFQDPALSFDGFDAVVPLRLADYAPMRMRPGGAFLIPDKRTVQTMHDKLRFNDFLAANGFGDLVPVVYGDAVEYPFIYKKHHDQAGIHSTVIEAAEQRAAFESGIDQSEYYKQRYVGGRNEYTTHVLAKDGRIVFDATVEFTFDRDLFVRGVKFESRAIDRIVTPFMDVFAGVVRALGYSGTCCFNYKIDNGKPLIFEVNPRIGGSLRLDLNPFMEAYLAALAGGG